jgi:hypothetical protein
MRYAKIGAAHSGTLEQPLTFSSIRADRSRERDYFGARRRIKGREDLPGLQVRGGGGRTRAGSYSKGSEHLHQIYRGAANNASEMLCISRGISAIPKQKL